jgi:hypothetical protein
MTSAQLYFPGQRLSEAELMAACLDGHLVALGDAFIAADAAETAALRGASLRPLLGDALAATQRSAAWVHGALDAPPSRHRVQRVTARRLHHIIDRRLEYHDRRLPADDLMLIGGVWVTTPTRTLADLARERDPVSAAAAGMLLRTGVADAGAGIAWLEAAGPLQNKRAALTRLRGWAVSRR